MIELAWLIPVFPVIGVLINGLFGKHVGEKAGPIASVMAGLSLLVVLGIASEMIFGAGGSHTIPLWTWVESRYYEYKLKYVNPDIIIATKKLTDSAIQLPVIR